MCRFDAWDSPEVYRCLTVRARKRHCCDECHRDIEPGESYRYGFGIWEGDSFSQHVCEHCMIPLQWLIVHCGGYVGGEVRGEICEHADAYPEVRRALDRIAVGMKRRWMRFDGNGLMPIPSLPPSIRLSEAA